jgi:hypothetical protein
MSCSTRSASRGLALAVVAAAVAGPVRAGDPPLSKARSRSNARTAPVRLPDAGTSDARSSVPSWSIPAWLIDGGRSGAPSNVQAWITGTELPGEDNLPGRSITHPTQKVPARLRDGGTRKSTAKPPISKVRPAVARAPGAPPVKAQAKVKIARAVTSPEMRENSPELSDSVQPPPPTEAELRARAEFERAQRAYDLGRFEDAIVHYSRAYEAMALPPFLFNIAQCHRLLGDHAQAAFFYRRYLDLAGNPPNAPLTRELLSEMEQRQAKHERLEREVGARVRASLMTQAQHPDDLQPVYRKWWFWAAVGVVTAGMTAVTIAGTQPPRTTLGTLDSR